MKIFLTPEGKDQLEKRLFELKTVKRPEITKKIGIAREYGDLSENAEYDSAKEEQGVLESEILEIEAKLRNCEIINKKGLPVNKISVGCHIKLHDETFDEEIEYQIIGSTESNPLKGLISNESLVGKALLGKRKGDVIEINTPSGKSIYKILSIIA
ncbi:MAG: transcription elongation factor GreA [Clostridia bacterium]|nr:transcription elongation factor GreA [Clostridia bacterium]